MQLQESAGSSSEGVHAQARFSPTSATSFFFSSCLPCGPAGCIGVGALGDATTDAEMIVVMNSVVNMSCSFFIGYSIQILILVFE